MSDTARERAARLAAEKWPPVPEFQPRKDAKRQGFIDGYLARDAEVAAAKAEAWDEGQKSGLRYADRAIEAHDIGRPDLPGPPSPNPYRPERTTNEH